MGPGSHVGFQISTKNTNLVEDHPVNISYNKNIPNLMSSTEKDEDVTGIDNKIRYQPFSYLGF
jgi:hypothetical protein